MRSFRISSSGGPLRPGNIRSVPACSPALGSAAVGPGSHPEPIRGSEEPGGPVVPSERGSARCTRRHPLKEARSDMPGTLVIVESPAKAKTIEKYLGDDYAVRASFGHVRDLPKSQLGVDVDDGFEPMYEVPEDSKRHVADLKRALKGADELVLATDYDREGEAIAFHVATLLGVPPDEAKRITFTEITRDAILESVRHPRAIDLKLVDAQEARRILDRLVGYRISPILWRKVRPGLSAGRVQSVAVRLIVEREREIRAFTPIEYWSVDVRLTPDGEAAALRRSSHRDPGGEARDRAREEGDPPRRRGRRDAARGAARSGLVPGRRRPAEGAEAIARAAVHDVHAAAGGGAEAGVLGSEDDDARAAPVRGHHAARRGVRRTHHVHADRLGDDRRLGPARDRRAREAGVRPPLRARGASPVQDPVAQRAGGARSRPAHVGPPVSRIASRRRSIEISSACTT